MPRFFMEWPNFHIDLLYTILLFVACFVIFYKTWQYYKLSNHKGLKYFALAFLFMGFSNLLSLFFPIMTNVLGVYPKNLIMPLMGMPFFHFIHVLLSFCMSVSVISLLMSVIWKKFKDFADPVYYMLLIVALLFTIPWLYVRARPAFMLVNTFIVIIAAVIGLVKYFKQKSKKKSFYIVYFLLFLFWFVHTAGSFMILFSWISGLILYCLSLGLLVVILYRVIKIKN